MTDEVRAGEGQPEPVVSGAGESHTPSSAPLVCVVCLAEGLPEAVAEINDCEAVYSTEDGEPVCEAHGFERSLTAMRSAR